MSLLINVHLACKLSSSVFITGTSVSRRKKLLSVTKSWTKSVMKRFCKRRGRIRCWFLCTREKRLQQLHALCVTWHLVLIYYLILNVKLSYCSIFTCLLSCAESGDIGKFIKDSGGRRELLTQEAEGCKNDSLKDLLPSGFAIHHAGMTRSGDV